MSAKPVGINLTIRGCHVVDPINGIDEAGDVQARVVLAQRASSGDVELDGSGWLLLPGLLDMHVHLREPGGEAKETIETGTAAAVAGGFTAVACMPNTQPPIDTSETVAWVLERARSAGRCRVLPIATITKRRAGFEVVDFPALLTAGAVAFSDDGSGVERDEVMREAGLRARDCDALLIQHCEFSAHSAGGVMHAGPTAQKLGLPGWDPRAEEAMVERDLDLVREIGFRYHVAHISTRKGIEMVRRAKAQNLPVSTEVCPHHLLLTDEACAGGDPSFKMNPPLRSADDVDACIEGVIDGTIDCVVTDHAPHREDEKARGFREAPFGVVGLEIALPLAYRALCAPGRLTWYELIDRMTRRPAEILRIPHAVVMFEPAPSGAAEFTLVDPTAEWSIDPTRFASKGRNTPFAGWTVMGRVMATIADGKIAFRHQAASDRGPALFAP